MFFILLFLLEIFLQTVSANTSTCSLEDLQTCKSDALGQMSTANGYDQEKICRDLRANFDCILWQTSTCFKKEDQDLNSGVIVKTWKYLQGFCKKYGNWWDRPCFQRDSLSTCETLLPAKHNSIDGPSCRMFAQFRDCVLSAVENSCSGTDRSLLGTYFMDKGQELVWRCPKGNDLMRMYASSEKIVSQEYLMYGDPPSGLKPCLVTAGSNLQVCKDKFETIQTEMSKLKDEKEKIQKLCCEIPAFITCVTKSVADACGDDAKDATESFVSPLINPVNSQCKDFEMDSCSGANTIGVTASFLICLAYLFCVKIFF